MNFMKVVCLCLGAVLCFFVATADQRQPPGVSNKLYNCTYDGDLTIELVARTHKYGKGSVVCGSFNGHAQRDSALNPKDVDKASDITLRLRSAAAEELFTVFLLNPDNEIPIKPILHHAVGNIPGNLMAAGNFTQGEEIVKFFSPNPPLPVIDFHYVYLAYKQQATVDYGDVKKLSTERFPIEDVAKDKNLSLVQSNFFVVRLGA